MSGYKSATAAQRRRATNQENPLSTSYKGPQASINSAKMFSSNYSQHSRSAQQPPQPKEEPKEGILGINKMTIPQAITLITLRLGQVETNIQQLTRTQMIQEMEHQGLNIEDMSVSGDGTQTGKMMLVDRDFVHKLAERVEQLEKSSGPNSAETTKIEQLKQQVDGVKSALTQTKVVINTLIKDAKGSKQGMDSAFCITVLVFDWVILVQYKMDRRSHLRPLFNDTIRKMFDLLWYRFPNTVKIKYLSLFNVDKHGNPMLPILIMRVCVENNTYFRLSLFYLFIQLKLTQFSPHTIPCLCFCIKVNRTRAHKFEAPVFFLVLFHDGKNVDRRQPLVGVLFPRTRSARGE
jgi:hypothetical protein